MAIAAIKHVIIADSKIEIFAKFNICKFDAKAISETNMDIVKPIPAS